MFGTIVVASYLGGYLPNKGRNLATREDIAEITKKVEEVKAVFAAQHEDHAQRNRLRLAALDKRLEVHQQAYALWHELLWSVHTAQVGSIVEKCQRWWVDNCLYLSAEAREAFPQAWLAANRHSGLLASDQGDETRRNWDRIDDCGRIIVNNAGLPGFTEHERTDVATGRTSKQVPPEIP